MSWDWVRANPAEAIPLAVVVGGVLTAVIRASLAKHREYVAITAHVKREEAEVWPALTKTIADNHVETLSHLAAHGERIAKLEAKMPNGKIDEMHHMLAVLMERRAQVRKDHA